MTQRGPLMALLLTLGLVEAVAAGIAGGPHDFTDGEPHAGTNAAVCATCHVPHREPTERPEPPQWDPEASVATATPSA